MPTVGESKLGREIGKIDSTKHFRYYWTKCPGCGFERWVCYTGLEDQAVPGRCKKCSRGGEKNPNWKGGRYLDGDGYVMILVQPGSPYFAMAHKVCNTYYVQEHRLVMAQHKGRCLTPEEIVDHMGTKYPYGSREDKADNRIENLRLTTLADNTAQTFPRLYARIAELEEENRNLKNLLSVQIPELERRQLQLEVEHVQIRHEIER